MNVVICKSCGDVRRSELVLFDSPPCSKCSGREFYQCSEDEYETMKKEKPQSHPAKPSSTFNRVTFQCSRCGESGIYDPVGSCPKCGAKWFVRASYNPPYGQNDKTYHSCKQCNLKMYQKDRVCRSCGAIRWPKTISSLAFSGFMVLFWSAAMGLVIYTMSQGNPTAGVGIVFVGVIYLLMLVWLGYDIFHLRKELNTCKQALAKVSGQPTVELLVISTPVSTPVQTVSGPSRLCKVYQSGNCVIQQRDTGPCTWVPENWENCNVVLENKKFHGTW